ncbi:hypothetical protein K445DRAFT_245090 [Daldinia sp. EC12]|nr:hypothetical protein K445DRAFT_245090 [Daldinia sp. EC12]
MYTWSDAASSTFGALCITSALPFVGVPFPTRSSAVYYAAKSKWMAERSGPRLTPRQAAYGGAVLRVAVGLCSIYRPTRVVALMVNGLVVCFGTVAAYRSGAPMMPQWGMLCAIGGCLLLEMTYSR